MAVTRLTLANIETHLLRICGGYAASTNAPWLLSATLYQTVNSYIQRLPIRVAQVAQKQLPAGTQRVRLDMWRTRASSTTSGTGVVVTASSATIYLPVDHDATDRWWDKTNLRKIPEIKDVNILHKETLKTKDPGPPEAIELLDFVSDGTYWRRQGTIHPATISNTTPSLELTYWRLPTAMPGSSASSEYPDLDPKYHWLAVVGPALELMAPTNPTIERLVAEEQEMLIDLAYSARVV